MDIKICFLVLSFSSLFLLHSTTAICVKCNTSQSFAHSMKPGPIVQPPLMNPTHTDTPAPSLAQSVVEPPLMNPTPSPSKTNTNSIEGVCAKTDDPEMCISIIPPSTGADPITILRFLIKMGTENSRVTLEVAKRFAENPALLPMVRATLKMCQESYSYAIDSFAGAMEAIDAHDLAKMNIMLSAALTNYDTCDTGFEDMPGVRSPMLTYDKKLSKLTSICLAISGLIK